MELESFKAMLRQQGAKNPQCVDSLAASDQPADSADLPLRISKLVAAAHLVRAQLQSDPTHTEDWIVVFESGGHQIGTRQQLDEKYTQTPDLKYFLPVWNA